MHARTILLNHLNFCRATFQLCKHVPCINLTDAVLLIIDDLMTIKRTGHFYTLSIFFRRRALYLKNIMGKRNSKLKLVYLDFFSLLINSL